MGLFLFAVLLAIAGIVWWSVSRATKQSEEYYRIDAERVMKIAQLEEGLQEKVALASAALKAADAAKVKADTAKQDAEEVGARLKKAKAALRRERAVSEESGEPELPPAEEVVFLRDQNGLLQLSLEIREKEAANLREALTLTEEALYNKTEQFDIMQQRHESLEKHSKRARRRAVLQSVFVGAGGFAFGFGVGLAVQP